VTQAGLELHHEPARVGEVRAPVRIRIPGLALRVRIPGRRLQRRLAAGVLAMGLVMTASAVAGLLSASHRTYLVDAAQAAPVAPAPRGSWVAAPPETAAPRVPRPVFLTIPAIGIRTRLIRLGLTASGAMQVPSTTTLAGWYSGSPPPGATGSAVIGGHVDSHLGPGIFFRLHLLRRGDRVYVRQADSRLAVFRVTSVQTYAKSRFPTADVYGLVPTPQLRLITCGGTFDPARGSYLSNVVVAATLIT
jgi:sortase (surface protein transpeptidase)